MDGRRPLLGRSAPAPACYLLSVGRAGGGWEPADYPVAMRERWVILALASLGFALGPPHRLYHRETIEQLATGMVPWPYVETTGRVKLVRMEADGDLHIQLTGVTAYVVLECIPELMCARPTVGQRIIARGIPRPDLEHRWQEIHPLIQWEAAP